jgi:hypothetical protein
MAELANRWQGGEVVVFGRRFALKDDWQDGEFCMPADT